MDFDLNALLAARGGEGYELYGKYLNPQTPKVLHAIGFDKVYTRGEGAYLWDTEGNQYTDWLAGFGVFAAGRNHPVIRKALHDALDAGWPSGPSSTARRCRGCSPSGCWPRRQGWTGCSSATAGPRRSSPR
jgi:glutamate-1-semialdehyde aminotransferase